MLNENETLTESFYSPYNSEVQCRTMSPGYIIILWSVFDLQIKHRDRGETALSPGLYVVIYESAMLIISTKMDEI